MEVGDMDGRVGRGKSGAMGLSMLPLPRRRLLCLHPIQLVHMVNAPRNCTEHPFSTKAPLLACAIDQGNGRPPARAGLPELPPPLSLRLNFMKLVRTNSAT